MIGLSQFHTPAELRDLRVRDARQRQRLGTQIAAISQATLVNLCQPQPAAGDVTRELTARGWTVHVARRLQPGADPIQAARSDWAATMTASLAVVDARGPETPPGAALITGALTTGEFPWMMANDRHPAAAGWVPADPP
jgi:hypothetical protein